VVYVKANAVIASFIGQTMDGFDRAQVVCQFIETHFHKKERKKND
jgi:hypothetical protein